MGKLEAGDEKRSHGTAATAAFWHAAKKAYGTAATAAFTPLSFLAVSPQRGRKSEKSTPTLHGKHKKSERHAGRALDFRI